MSHTSHLCLIKVCASPTCLIQIMAELPAPTHMSAGASLLCHSLWMVPRLCLPRNRSSASTQRSRTAVPHQQLHQRHRKATIKQVLLLLANGARVFAYRIAYRVGASGSMESQRVDRLSIMVGVTGNSGSVKEMASKRIRGCVSGAV